MADARDLKSRGSDPVPVRPRSPAPYRGVEQLVARRAHNPEVAGSNPVPATRKNAWNHKIPGVFICFFVFAPRFHFSLTPFLPQLAVKNVFGFLFDLYIAHRTICKINCPGNRGISVARVAAGGNCIDAAASRNVWDTALTPESISGAKKLISGKSGTAK